MAIASRRDVVLITVAAVALVGAGAIFWTSGTGSSTNPDFPEGHAYICADCGYVTVLSDDELFRLKREARESESLEPGRVVCAKCGSANTQLAVKCPNCGEYFPRPGPGRPVCPHCQQPFPSLFDDD
jgi:Zn finger protein HypA/HybF involved in hydrogenase expression